MPATAVYTIAMRQADAYDYTRGAIQAAGAALGAQAAPTHIDFTLTRRDAETGSMDVAMPGRAVVVAEGEDTSRVTLSIEPATQFAVYALGIGLIALVPGGWLFGTMSGLWFVIVAAAEAYLVWSVFSKWPAAALDSIRQRMSASPAVSGGAPVVQPSGSIFAPPGPSPPASVADIADQIRRLAELRDQGHVTPEEFEAKKAELLKRI
ncbi:MAG TPA: SHOCT domain-containing protein [Rhizomicrobium sp.]